MAQPTNYINRDKNFDNISINSSAKIPSYATLAAAGDFPTQQGEIIYDEGTTTFYGHDGTTWVALGGSAASAGVQIIDNDGDTLVSVEETPDSDTIVGRVGDNSSNFNVSNPVFSFSTGACTIFGSSGADDTNTNGTNIQMAGGLGSNGLAGAIVPGNGGGVIITGGIGGSNVTDFTGGNGGPLVLTGGPGTFTGNGGSVAVVAGSTLLNIVTADAQAGDGGDVEIQTGSGGDNTIAAGTGSTRAGDGGTLSFSTGNGGNSDSSQPNSGGNGGDIEFETGDGNGESGNGGSVTFQLGDGDASSGDATGGNFAVLAGANINNGQGGLIVMTAGEIPNNSPGTNPSSRAIDAPLLGGSVLLQGGIRPTGLGSSPGSIEAGEVRLIGGRGQGNPPGAVMRGGRVTVLGGECNGGQAGDVFLAGGTSLLGTGNPGVTGNATVTSLDATTSGWTSGEVRIWGGINSNNGIAPGIVYICGGEHTSDTGGDVFLSSGIGGGSQNSGNVAVISAPPGIGRSQPRPIDPFADAVASGVSGEIIVRTGNSGQNGFSAPNPTGGLLLATGNNDGNGAFAGSGDVQLQPGSISSGTADVGRVCIQHEFSPHVATFNTVGGPPSVSVPLGGTTLLGVIGNDFAGKITLQNSTGGDLSPGFGICQVTFVRLYRTIPAVFLTGSIASGGSPQTFCTGILTTAGVQIVLHDTIPDGETVEINYMIIETS